MKKFSKKESCSTEIGVRRKSDNRGNVNLKQLFRRKKLNSPTHTETNEPNNLDVISIYKKLCQKNFCIPSNFRERYPSANYDEVQQKVISNIKVVPNEIPNEKLTEVLKPKERNLKYNNMSHNICKRISEVSFTTSSERPSCATVKQSLVSCNKDELTSHYSDLYFHDGNYGSLYDSKETVLDNGINGTEIDVKKSDRDLEQLVYFLKEHLGLKYSFEPTPKPIMEFDECSLKASKNSLFSLLFNVSSHSELSSYDHKSAVVQQTVANNFSSTKTNFGSVSAANSSDDSVIVEENQEEISPTPSTESYEVQEIKCEYNTARCKNNQERQHDKEEKEDPDPVDEKHLDGDSEGSSTGSEQTVDASKRSVSHMTSSKSNDSSGSKDNEGNGKSEENNKDGIEKSQEKKQENEKSEDNDEEHGSEESQENKQENGKGEDNEEEDGNEKGDKDKAQEPAEETEETEKDEDEGKTDSNGETDGDVKSWLESIQDGVFSLLSKLNYIRGPTICDSVIYTYRYIRSAADHSQNN